MSPIQTSFWCLLLSLPTAEYAERLRPAGEAAPRHSLHRAAEAGCPKTIEQLLAKKADVNARDGGGRTPLHCLLDGTTEAWLLGRRVLLPPGEPGRWRTGEREKALRLLLGAGADPSAADNSGHTPLFYAHKHAGSSELPSILIRKGAELNFLDAVELEHVVRLEKLITADAKLLERTYAQGETALHRAAAAGAVRSAALMLEYGARVNGRDKSGQAPLHYAAQGKSKEMASLLVARGGRPGLKDRFGQTPLLIAAYRKEVELVKALIEKREALDDDAYRGALHIATLQSDSYPVAAALLKHRGGVTLKDEFGVRMVLQAVAMGHYTTVQILLDAGAATNHPKVDFSPLHRAAQIGNVSLIGMLIGRGAQVNACDKNDRTPLHYAAEAGSRDTVQALVSYGADANAVDRRGATPLSLAQNPTVREILQRAALWKK